MLITIIQIIGLFVALMYTPNVVTGVIKENCVATGQTVIVFAIGWTAFIATTWLI